MGLLADDVRVDRRAGLRALVVLVLLLGVGFAAAWLTIGRNARFQSLKGVFLGFELPDSFTQIEEEGSGESISSLGKSAELRRTYATTLKPDDTCRALHRSFTEGDVAVLRIPVADPLVTCSFSGPVGEYSLRADVRTPQEFLNLVRADGADIPSFPPRTRAVASMTVDP